VNENLSVWEKQIETLNTRFGKALEEIRMPNTGHTDVPIIYVKKERLIELLAVLKSNPDFDYAFLADLTATDEIPNEPRFEVVYNLYSVEKHRRIRVKTRVAEAIAVPTATSLWAGANWAEREVFDMFGIVFDGHPELRRILNHEEFVGHPLRKDYYISKYQVFSEAEPVHPELLK
jgi:NADH/F420H2 dehydrogenase subunit C